MTGLLLTGGTALAVPVSSGSLPPPTAIVTAVPTPTPCGQIIITHVNVVATDPDTAPTACPTPCDQLVKVDAFVTDPPSMCPTPFESFQGETGGPNSTPPPTGTAPSSDGGPTPIFAILIAALFGALGLAAAQAQRRSVKRR